MLELAELLSGICGCAPRVPRAEVGCFTRIGNDSRNLTGGELFVALRTANGDGHAHIGDALAMGAGGVLAERPLADLGVQVEGPLTEVLVDDVRTALELWAAHRLERTRLVVVTGTLGKSTAREALRSAWAGASGGEVFANDDRNDSLGLPLALSEAASPPVRAVLEAVADGAREEDRLGGMLRPEVVLLTSSADAASLYWRSAAALGASWRRTWPSAGALVAPAGPGPAGRARHDQRLITFGPLGSGAGVTAGPLQGGSESRWPEVWACRLQAGAVTWEVRSRLHPALAGPAFAAAVACLRALGADEDRGVPALSGVGPLPGRLRPVRVGPGLLVDDTFDSTPTSVRLALSVLSALPPPRLAVLGAVRGPGRRRVAVPRGVETLRLSAAGSGGPTPAEAEERLRSVLREGGSALVKGRSESRLERLVQVVAPAGTRVVRWEPGRRLTPYRSTRRPTWVEIDQEALAANVAEVVAELGPVQLMAVVKADAYGHGAVQVARTALKGGAAWVATATVAEAADLRAAGIGAPCLVLGYTPPGQVEEAMALGLALTVFDAEVLEAMAVAGDRTGAPANAHLKVDTGMSRLGVAPRDVARLVRLARAPVELEAVYTHLRRGEDAGTTAAQVAVFEEALAAAESVGHHFRIRHVANSAAWRGPLGSRFDMVRLGGELLGLRTADGRRRRPVLALKTTVAQVREIAAGTYVGYGDAHRAERRTRVATLPVGYGDGFRRGPRTWGSVLIRGREHPLIGDVCMDMAMVDVTSDPAIARGDEVVLIGRQGAATLAAEEVAERLGVLNYELVSQILPRVPREQRGGF